MCGITKKSALMMAILAAVIPLYAEGENTYMATISPSAEKPSLSNAGAPQNSISINLEKKETYSTFTDWVNKRPYAVVVEKDNETLREDWEKALGMDIFYPYFKAREVKDKVEEKSSIMPLKIKGLTMKGKAEIDEDRALYIFSVKF